MDKVSEFENALRVIEGELEKLGRSICSDEGSGRSWNAINSAIESVQDAIHAAYLMRRV